MKRLLRWIAIAVGGLAALALIACAVVYVLSERELRRIYPVAAVAISVPTDPASIAEGQRLATVRGCFAGCHGKQAQGGVLFDEPKIARIIAPNLTAVAHRYTDAELAVAIRHGVRPGGHSMLVMPSETFHELNDADLGRIIAFLKSLPEVSGREAGVSLGPLGRIGLATGKFKMTAQHVAEAAAPPAATGEEASYGRYLARTICATCHSTNLRGGANPAFSSPNLRLVAAYSPEAFMQLLRTGIPPGGKALETMGEAARENLSQLTDVEISALYSYLHSMPEAVADH